LILSAIFAALDQGCPTEPELVAETLRERRELDRVGGEARLYELKASAPSALNSPHFAGIVVAAARRRRELEVAKALGKAALNGGLEADPALQAQVRELIEARARGDAIEPLDLDELLSGPLPETAWRWQRWLAQGDLALLAGDPGIGKSIVMLLLADAVRRGADFLGESCERGTVGLFDYENPLDEAAKRLRRVGVTAQEHEGFCLFHCPPLDLGSPAGVQAFAETVERHQLDLIVIDSLRRAAPGLDENDSAAVSSVLSPLRSLTAASGRTVVVVHHSRKRTGDNSSEANQMVRGSLDLVASVDALLYIRSKESGTFTLEHAKSRRGLPHAPIQVRIDGDGDDAELRLVNEGPVAFADDKVEAMLAKIIAALREDGCTLERQVLALRVGTDPKNSTYNRALNLGYDRQQLAKPDREKPTDPQLYALAPEYREI
jgi:energy-coupling factor transporter ATP-binding protein EcfA2